MNWINILAVFVGSGLGGVCRYLVNKITFTNVQSPAGFPWGTFAVNIAGCFLIGLFSGLFSRYDSSSLVSPQIRLLLTVGFCGGFTTFSTFINESFIYFQSVNYLLAVVYISASVISGFLLLYAGYALSQLQY